MSVVLCSGGDCGIYIYVCCVQGVTVVLRDVKQSQISEEELKLLLGYVEEDIHDYQLTAFPLLRVTNSLLRPGRISRVQIPPLSKK